MGLNEDALEAALVGRRQEDRWRSLRRIEPSDRHGCVRVDGVELVNFASNDYLGLSAHPLLKERACQYTQLYGAGSTASRLLSGNLDPYERIEKKLAQLKNTEAALILPTGFQANSTLLPALAGAGGILVCDRLVHASMAVGLLSGSSRWLRYAHNDLGELEERLSEPRWHEKPRWIVTESVFSMDGDKSDVDELLAIAGRTQAALYIDEAHSTGLFGDNGMGMCSGAGSSHIVMGTFGKAMGSFGSYIACSSLVRDFVINFCSGMIFSTGLPPSVLGSIDAALDIVPGLHEARSRLFDNSDYLRQRLHCLGFDTGNSVTQIIPIIVGSDHLALSLATSLERAGYYAPAIRPPTVPPGAARVRISLTAAHDRQTIDSLITTLASWHEKEN